MFNRCKAIVLSVFIALSFSVLNPLIAQNNTPTKVTLAGINLGEIEKDSLMKCNRLEINNEQYTIATFTISVQTKDRLVEQKVIGSDLSDGLKERFFSDLKPNDKLYVDRIKVMDDQGITYEMKPISIRIK